jgi:eukaryotic-like serine/threonine-protein kinase
LNGRRFWLIVGSDMTPGTTVGDFEILEKLGEGGMGEVYRARDTRLGREVAIKILPAAVTSDPERLERLAREARVLASLNHPNIAALHAIETSGPAPALVLELVQGETLGARIRRKPLSITEAREIARQIMSALDAAHELGIVHRDLKPDNVMIGPRGLVKVLDFGLAKAVVREGADAPTLTAGPSADGMIVGTAAYMSPEQARGQPVDRRTDIWAFGCVLYEMLSARRAFSGPTVSDTIVATLERDPNWTALPSDTPAGMRRLLARTLQKDPHLRLRDIADGTADLDAPDSAATVMSRGGFAPLPWALLAIALGAAAWLWLRQEPAAEDPILGSLLTPLTRDAGLSTSPALSKDGRLLAYASDRAGGGTLDIWVQQIDGGTPIRLTDDEADDTAPDFSPDGNQIVFQSDRGGGGAYVVATFGRTPSRLVAPGGRQPRFSPDGTRIAYWAGAWRGGAANTVNGIYVVAFAGGTPQRLAENFRSARAPVWAPDGRSLLFLGRPDNSIPVAESFDWYWVKLDGSPPVKVGLLDDPALQRAEASPSNWVGEEVVYSDGKDLWSLRISPSTGQRLAPPRRLTVSAGTYQAPVIGPDGRVVFASTQNVRVIERAPLDGTEPPRPPVQLFADLAADTGRPSETRDGETIVFERSPSAGTIEVWTRNVRSGIEQLITRVASSRLLSATISPDGSRISYTVLGESGNTGRGFVVESARGVPSQVCESCVTTGFLSDNRRLLIHSGRSIRVHDVFAGSSVEAVSSGAGSLHRPHASPDDRWLAFGGNLTRETSRAQSFVAPLRPGQPVAAESLMPIREDPLGTGRPTGWSLDSRTVYLLLDTDGFRCLWGQRIDAAGRLDGKPTPIRHFHGADWAALSTSFGNSVTADGFMYSTIKSRGNIWSLARR